MFLLLYLPRLVRQGHDHGDLLEVRVLDQNLVQKLASFSVVDEQRVLLKYFNGKIYYYNGFETLIALFLLFEESKSKCY